MFEAHIHPALVLLACRVQQSIHVGLPAREQKLHFKCHVHMPKAYSMGASCVFFGIPKFHTLSAVQFADWSKFE